MDQRIFEHAARLRRNRVIDAKIIANLTMNGLSQSDAEMYIWALDRANVQPGQEGLTLLGRLELLTVAAVTLGLGIAIGVMIQTSVPFLYLLVAVAGFGFHVGAVKLLNKLGLSTQRNLEDPEAHEFAPLPFMPEEKS